MAELSSVAQAETMIRQNVGDFGVDKVLLGQASGRILRQRVMAERDQPPYDRVMMDGIAIRHGDVRSFHIHGTQRAGAPVGRLVADDSCLNVTTGAILPEGSDTVVPIERLSQQNDQFSLEPGYTPEAGQFVHARASDCRTGDVLLEPGIRLNAPALAVLAANGYARVEVARSPSIGILSTGDELVPVEGPVQEWEIRRSNEQALAGALRTRGLTDIHIDWAGDDLDDTIRALEKALSVHDVLILSGGVSMGSFDYVPRALERLGVERIFHKIAQRPGKPMWFGIGRQGQRIFALPGNPVSALTCCMRYVVPSLLTAMGARTPERFTVMLDAAIPLIPTLARFVPVRLRHDARGCACVSPQPASTSGDFSHLATTDGFVELPPGEGSASAGTAAVFHGW
ncbi:molybdopterin molybdenumtransferase MoeA [Neoasaia chiangmaiensis]|nr:molybdopterin molybdotransferase MoeA [Neoasaia chiangmaiensis]GEN13591.1 molybdopterin molybdenumtransferase MoeA [Neoasaia chiangmaiensis]